MNAPVASEGCSFLEFLRQRLARGTVSTEDALASVLPLIRQVVEVHAAGRVAPLRGVLNLRVEGVRLWFEAGATSAPLHAFEQVRAMDRPESLAFEVVEEGRLVENVGDEGAEYTNLRIGKPGAPVTAPVFLQGYASWEHDLGHHDPLTDVYSLGMILASLALGLDFSEMEDLKEFVESRRNLFAVAPDLHPVLATAIVRMTELKRHKRAQDLPGLLRGLENYRDQSVDVGTDLARAAGLKNQPPQARRRALLERLRDRLFEVSRRNRLLYFRPTLNTLNLTVASVPMLFDVRGIRPEQLLTWQPDFASQLLSGTPIALGRYLRFEDAPYISGALDHIIAEAKRDQTEFGFSQLRLVLCFLRWHNLKEAKEERIETPLLLLPVQLSRKKGVRDVYVLQAPTTEAVVNPTLRYHLKQLYGIQLPELIDLSKSSLDDFFADLTRTIQASEPAVVLNKVDKPHINLIHEKARRRLEQYQRKISLRRRGQRSYKDMNYSYDRDNFIPLGLELFRNRVRPVKAQLGDVAGRKGRPLAFAVPDIADSEREHNVAELRQGSGSNPYSWDFDLCNITLGNFKYRKMSLVRDYDALVEQDVPNAAFESIFSLAPRQPATAPMPLGSLEKQFPVVACDPTQGAAIARAQGGQSFIIQGPPGTGKSQTITNLIASYVAAGRRVLFVCEKRAAIDVVFQRLKQHGLHELCCLIHDSQEDKKTFVMDLKETYERFIAEAAVEEIDWPRRRDQILEAMGQDLEPLRKFEEAMEAIPDHIGVTLRRLIERRVELPDLAPGALGEEPPVYRYWHDHRDAIGQLVAALKEVEKSGVLARHPLSLLSCEVLKTDAPVKHVRAKVETTRKALEGIQETVQKLGAAMQSCRTLGDLAAVVTFSETARFLCDRDLYALADARSPAGLEFSERISKHRSAEAALAETRKRTTNWTDKLPEEELELAVEIARRLQGAMAFLKPSWWSLRKTVNARYDFSRHAVKPTRLSVLEALRKEYAAAAVVRDGEKSAREVYRTDLALQEFAARLEQLRGSLATLPDPAAALHRSLLRREAEARLVSGIAELREPLEKLAKEMASLIAGWETRTSGELLDDLDRIEEASDQLPDFLPVLAEIQKLPETLAQAFRRLPVDSGTLEAGMADRSFSRACLDDRHMSRFTGTIRERHRGRLGRLHKDWLESNARTIRTFVRDRFLQNIAQSSRPNEDLDATARAFKKSYTRGRKDLEHEFGKTMRYRSIRDLLQDPETGRVIPDLKPVWLMSPLSVSDTLPLDSALLDVVIFDEASQIPLEDGLPAIFRANQVIVVGDQMQLPPTTFFSSKSESDDLVDDSAEGGADAELASNSFLAYAAKNLHSTMLGWHYRSRSESLISFSNSRFYEGRLYTIPESRRLAEGLEELTASTPQDGGTNLDRSLQRSVSFHFMSSGVYFDRRNATEAAYIAHLVRGLLEKSPGVSIGVVAFSEAQQAEIESALDDLAALDAAFRDRLEREREREEDGQFVGLLVKNLENIQGDERDIVILSVCYGKDPTGRMLMNFGPINQTGGEKRLNVAFSRAKKHMMIVSSIRFHEIKNDYNEGAACLRNYLRYAERLSCGDYRGARGVLDEIIVRREKAPVRMGTDPVTDQVALELAQAGFEVDRNVGQSRLQCDLAVRRPGEVAYLAGILVDTRDATRRADTLTREVMTPGLLKAFGWRIHEIMAKDWYQDRAGVMTRLRSFLAGEDAPESAEPSALPPPPMRQPGKIETPAAVTEERPPSPAPPPAQAAAPNWTGAGRTFELRDGTSQKFWGVELQGPLLRVRFGRIGTDGQSLDKTLASPTEAARAADKLIREKTGKGYRETTRPGGT